MKYIDILNSLVCLQLKHVEEFYLPQLITNEIRQTTTLIGDAVIATRDTTIGFEICEELWNPLRYVYTFLYK